MNYRWSFEVTEVGTIWSVAGDFDQVPEVQSVQSGTSQDLATAIEDAYEAVGLDRPMVLDPNGEAEL